MPADHSDQKNPNARKRNGPREDQKGYSTSEAILELSDSLVSASHGNREEKNENTKRKPTWIEVATLVLLLLTTAGLAVQDSILYSSDGTFKDTLTNQKDSNERQLRAYVGVVPGDVENFGDPDEFQAKLVRKNYGLTPAYDVALANGGNGIMVLGASIPTIPGEEACIKPAVEGLITMFPQAELPFIGKFQHRGFTAEAIDDVHLGKKVFVHWGTLCYNDVWNRPHFTDFCWMYKGTDMTAKTADGCLTHNSSN